MKKNVSAILIAMVFVCFSCKDDFHNTSIDDVFIVSSIDSIQVAKMRKAMRMLKTRASGAQEATITEMDAEAILAPFVSRGRTIQNQVLEMYNLPENHISVTPVEREMVESLSDEALAMTAVVIDVCLGNIEPYTLDGYSVSVDRILACVSSAIGFAEFSVEAGEITISGVIKVMKAVAKKSGLGAITVALLIYDFLDCLYG